MHRLLVFFGSGTLLFALAGVGLPTRAALPEHTVRSCGAVWYEDADADGYGVIGNSIVACRAPRGFTTLPGDCDDVHAEVNPGADEVCNDRDDDCDGSPDEVSPVWYRDADADGWGDPANTWSRCDRPDGYVERGGDCDDADPDAFHGTRC